MPLLTNNTRPIACSAIMLGALLGMSMTPQAFASLGQTSDAVSGYGSVIAEEEITALKMKVLVFQESDLSPFGARQMIPGTRLPQNPIKATIRVICYDDESLCEVFTFSSTHTLSAMWEQEYEANAKHCAGSKDWVEVAVNDLQPKATARSADGKEWISFGGMKRMIAKVWGTEPSESGSRRYVLKEIDAGGSVSFYVGNQWIIETLTGFRPAEREVENLASANSPTEKLSAVSEAFGADDVLKIRSLIAAGAKVDVRNKYGVTPLYSASRKGHVEAVKLLLASGADVNAPNAYGSTPLWRASRDGHVEIVNLLLASKADVNATNLAGSTPLFIASTRGHLDVVKPLLAAKAQVDIADSNGNTPLLRASWSGHTEIVRLLLASKADVSAVDLGGHTPLILATRGGHVEVAKLLLQAGADLNAATRTGGNALFYAAMGGKAELVELFIESKADFDAVNSTGTTPLFVAARGGHTEVVKLLLVAGADVNGKVEPAVKNPTPLDMAKRLGHTNIVALLKEHGARE